MLVVFAGLPGTGKSTLAREAAQVLGALLLSVDPIESAIHRSGVAAGQPTGLAAYFVAETVAGEQLALGHTVVVDAVNAVEAARQGWRNLARLAGVPLRFIECVCSDEAVHRGRLETRKRDLPGVREPTWEDVIARRREYAPWAGERVVLETAHPFPTVLERLCVILNA